VTLVLSSFGSRQSGERHLTHAPRIQEQQRTRSHDSHIHMRQLS
jgi:hypothetical protein